MFCANCGAAAKGIFCSKCGASLSDEPAPADLVTENWSREIVYEKLIRVPEVRALISRQAATARKRLSGEDFLALCDKVVSLGIPLEKIGSVAQSMCAGLGVKTGKEHLDTFSTAIGTVIVAVLCSLAHRGQEVRHVQQFEDGCLFEAALPSDIWSFEGSLFVGVRRGEAGTRVEGATKIEGQLFDWGKSKRCLQALFADIEKFSA